MVTIYKVAAIFVFRKIAVYFKLNYFKLIHLQANMLSSFIFTYFAVIHTNLPQKLLLGLRKHKIKDINSRWLSHFESSPTWQILNYHAKVLCN